ncbi:MAG TPA: UDP-N-acetylmuramoyl-tripeptide--D-alanyl-D-alanine ligase, partial [Longimicrobiales bacterium]|nr:UDP-N-acetylmuramoyl-tripeptide--D-alanyl-D-alanine ligase [Longimicrobiales bacterium]
ERFDGHDFVTDAASKGARGAVVSRPPSSDADVRLYPVKDTLVALGALAAHRRRDLRAPVVAITGSSGKTTTKDLTSAALAATKRVHATRGNLNNRIGMPLTLLGAPEDAEVVVLEMGSNEPGEIRTLAQIARPDVGVVTTVGEAHLERLGSLEGVLEEKLDLLRNLAAGGRCVVGDEPPRLAERAREVCASLRVAGWSRRADEDLRPADATVDVFGRWEFGWRGATVKLPMAGRHAVADALLALAVADLLGVPPHEAAAGIARAEAGAMRGEMRRVGSLSIIVDCYNANPQSVRAALDVLEGQSAGRRVAVLGTMLELGEESARLHRDVLADALARPIDLIVATGAFAEAARELGATDGGRLVTAADWQEAYPALREWLEGDELVLLKASRGVALEGILPLLEQDF